jgi:ABC-2 type transport system ATP-binding protein
MSNLMELNYENPERAADSSDIVLELRGVSKSFFISGRKVQALRDINLKANRGQITGLIGPDGAGKTTLMRIAAGLLIPDTGQVTVLGMDAARESLAVQSAIGYMPQRFGLYEDLTLQENLDLYADLQGIPRQTRPTRYQELMHMTGLAPFTSRLSGRLSGGMKQKLGLACTLVRSPRLLLLDEPTVGVDPVSRRELWDIIYRLVQQEGTSVLLSTAYLDEAERCHRVILLHEGEVLGHGTPQRFSEQLQGRTYTVEARGMNKRAIREKLAEAESVIDAVILGDRVRLVMDTQSPPPVKTLLPHARVMSVESVPPRLEDSFIAILRTHRPKNKATQTKAANTGIDVQTGNPTDYAIQVTDLKRRFGDFYAVKGITFNVSRGEVFGLLGPNGAGKSTTFRMLCGLLPPSAGNLSVAGVDLRRAAADARAHIGYMSQKFSLYGNLSAKQNLKFFSSAYGLLGQHQAMRIAWALEQFDLVPFADATSMDLPLGYKQRLAMACALMHEPDILFLDEPTSGVDPLARREFWSRISSLTEQGVTVMVTTHFMEEAEYCDRLAIMADGEVLALGTPADIREQARSPQKPEPTMEDAFITLIKNKEKRHHE